MKKEIEYSIIKRVNEARLLDSVHTGVINTILSEIESHVHYCCEFEYNDDGELVKVKEPVDGDGYEHEQYLRYKEFLHMYEVISEL